MSESPKFIADAMLGKLAKWLRIIGCDVEYFAEISDEDLVKRARLNERLILTRDTFLVRRRWVRENHFFVTGDDYRCQLRQVVKAFSLDPKDRLLTRCIICNEPLLEVPKNSVTEKVPPYVAATQKVFKACPICGRVYWDATHREKILEDLKKILGEC
jgi:hypothetical protein